MDIILIIIIVILVVLLIILFRRNSAATIDKEKLALARETVLDIAGKIINSHDAAALYQYILESSLKLIPKAKSGSILMFNPGGYLEARASVGFKANEIRNMQLRLEETYLYKATEGKVNRTVVINRLENIVLSKNSTGSGEKGSVLKSQVASPLYRGRELAGMFCVYGDQIDIFTEQDGNILDYMSKQIAIVLHNQKLYEEIQHLSKFDAMTNLIKRDSFEKEAEKLLNDPSKDAGNLYFVLMDLDDLKVANDTVGHRFGDEVIKSFADLIKKYLGKNDLFARYDGDEFAAVIQGDRLVIGHALDDAKTEFANAKVGLLTSDFVPSFSFGMASFLESNFSLDTLYKLADGRMQEEKRRRQREKEHEHKSPAR